MTKNKDYNSWFSDILSSIMDIKIWNLQQKKCKEYAHHVEEINESSQRLSLLVSRNMMFTTILELLFTNTLYIFGAYLIAGEQLSFGSLIAFVSFAAYLFSPVNAIMDLRLTLKQNKPSVEGLKKYFSLEEENSVLFFRMSIYSGGVFRKISPSARKSLFSRIVTYPSAQKQSSAWIKNMRHRPEAMAKNYQEGNDRRLHCYVRFIINPIF